MTKELPALVGSEKQITWAMSIRDSVLMGQMVTEAQELAIRDVADSTWWIANKDALRMGRFKPPSPHQMAGASKVSDPPLPLKDGSRPEPPRHVNSRLSDARGWAKSVSQNPKMAEAAILSVLHKLYKDPEMKAELRTAAYLLLDECEWSVQKDVEAIKKMLDYDR